METNRRLEEFIFLLQLGLHDMVKRDIIITFLQIPTTKNKNFVVHVFNLDTRK